VAAGALRRAVPKTARRRDGCVQPRRQTFRASQRRAHLRSRGVWVSAENEASDDSAVAAVEDSERVASGFPSLYESWFNGDLEALVATAIQNAKSAGVRSMEVYIPCVPNVDEVDFGTALNQKFAQRIAPELGMVEEYKKVRKYLVPYANVYWSIKAVVPALRSAGCSGKIAVVCADGVEKGTVALPTNVELVSLRSALSREAEMRGMDGIIVVDPRSTSHWTKGGALGGDSTTTVMLNSAFSETYDLCGPLPDCIPTLFVKRISKGWMFRVFPKSWEVCLERPDGSIEVLSTVDNTKPKLREVAKIVREESFKRYSIFNDRWSKGFGARL